MKKTQAFSFHIQKLQSGVLRVQSQNFIFYWVHSLVGN